MGTPIGTGVDPPQLCRSVWGSSARSLTIGEPIGLGIAKKELTIVAPVGVATIDLGEGSAAASDSLASLTQRDIGVPTESGLAVLPSLTSWRITRG